MAGLGKGLAILECFGDGTGQLTVTEAARRAGLSRAAARRCLLTLLELGYVAHDGRHFTPLPRLLRLGHAFLSSVPLPRLAQPILERAEAEVQEAVSLAIPDGDEVVFVARAAPRRMVALGPSVGSRLPAWCSATGRVLLAARPDEAVAEQFAGTVFRPLTPRTVMSAALALDRVREARALGHAICDEELELGLRSMAVPVRDLDGRVVAAMSVSTQAGRLTVEDMRVRLLPVLLEGSARLSAKL